MAVRSVKKLIVVVCEGKLTEPNYLKRVERYSNSAIVSLRIEATAHTAPKQLVEVASEVRRKAGKDFRKTGDPNTKVDEVWVVCDIDSHPFVHEAVDQARGNDIHLAISNPSFELWLLLHFADQTASIDRKEALHRLKSYIPSYSKGGDCFEELTGRYAEARSRAEMLDKKHEGDGTKFPDDNPSSGMRMLVNSLAAEY